MDTPHQSEDRPQDYERSLQQLAWTLQASVGQFKLIWARCNYSDLRTRLIERLSEICKIKIQVLQLKESERTLFTAIRSELQPDTQALMIVGWESLHDLPQMLTSANQVREEFRKNLSIPVVVWISEEIHHTIMEIAPDLESWGTSRSFAIAPDDLSEFINQLADEYFSGSFSVNDYRILELELEAAQRELRFNDHETEANLASLLGFVKQTNNRIDDALKYYQKARVLWSQLNKSEKQVSTLGEIAYCYYLKAFKIKDIAHPDWQATRQYTQEYITFLNEANSQDLAANSIAKFGNILRDLKEWEQLKYLAQQALEVHQANNQPIELAKDYGFLAQVALAQKRWSEAKQLAQKAKDILTVPSTVEVIDSPKVVFELAEEPAIANDLTLYHFILAQAEYELGSPQQAIQNLEVARDASSPIKDLHLHLNILSYLQRLYFEKKEYLEAYNTKQQQRSIEQQFGLRAFIGAGRLQSTKQTLVTLSKAGIQESIAPEIAASGRLLDIERLVERLGRHDHKLIVIHGQSGVGKSSLVNAGLVPALKNKSVGIQDYLPVAIRVYTNWVEELGQSLQQALHERRGAVNGQALGFEVDALIAQLRENEQHNLRTVLIFDQFEEFFFVYSKLHQRQQFFEFLGECLNILSVKVILSLRVDYLHYLLECNRLSSMAIIGNDLLSNNVLYELGNFSPDDTKSIIQRLIKTTSFNLECALIGQIVIDLAVELGEVRPIELQIVGAQLQTENITTLAEYQQRGTKEELVKRYLAEVVNDCGVENQQIAEFLLYLLTDEKGTRPLKTRVEIELELQALAAEIATNSNSLDLVLEILVKSGLVILLPENRANRYQLVHDYIAVLVRQQQEPKLSQLMTQLEQEKQQRKLSEEQRKLGEVKLNSFLKRALFGSVAAGVVLAVLAVTAFFQTQQAKEQRNLAQNSEIKAQEQRNLAQISEIKALANSSEALLLSEQNFDALIQSLKAGGNVKNAEVSKLNNIRMQTIVALREASYLQPDENQFRERNRLEGHSGGVNSVSFSPDNQTIATASDDNTVKLWDRSGKELKTLKGHSGWVNSVSFSPDNQTIATASSDNTVKLWDRSGKELKTLKGHSGWVNSVSFSPDNQTIATASDDNTVKLWDRSGKELKTLKGHSGWVNSVSFSPDNQTIATASYDNTVKLWDRSGKELKTLKGHSGGVSSVSFSPDNQTIATASYDNTVKLWDRSGKELKTLKGHSGGVSSVSFSPDNQTIATASSDKTVKLWDRSGKELKTLKGHSGWVNSVSFSPDNQTIATASYDNTVKLWDRSGKELKTLKGHSGGVNSVSFSPDNQTIATASDDNTVKLWDRSGKELKTLKGHSGGVNSVSFSPDNQTIATASSDNTVKLWDRSGKELKTLKGHSGGVNSVSFSPDNQTIATASSDNTVKLWDRSGKELKTLKGHSGGVNSVSFSPDNQTIATASYDKTVKLWDRSGKELKTLKGHSGGFNSVSFSPDNQTIATASSDNTVKLWDRSGKELKTLKGHSGGVNSVSFSPDNQTIATASYDNTVKLWDRSGKELKTLKGHSGGVNSVSFSPDNQTIATASSDKTVKLWDLNLDNLLKDGCSWLNNYLAIHPDILEELTVCQISEIKKQAASALVAQGENLARKGNIQAAVTKLHKAQQWNVDLKLNPTDPGKKAQQLADSSSLVAQGEESAQAGDLESAVVDFQKALKLDSKLEIEPRTKAASILFEEGTSLVIQEKFKEALEAYDKAQAFDSKIEISAENWNSLCRQGSLKRQANIVLPACNKAVALSPSDRNIQDSRGLARALTGDTKGAIADFEAYIAQADGDTKAQRQRWVKELRAGKNPFTDAELKKLREQ
ncbi:ribosome assembly protein 4 [Nostoc sp. ATCC 53789]|uniref:WD40 domain-containing protein n=1 Tax=Nostoc sp. ATCC 53789 TaxID=76335 RepID=UPI00132ED980|nr:ribosome assembly protein 4 [Nostoc sp. ATCC 53789]QHG20757.1 ribosome assembly protein 4 [Nostoc sp. ATCC 53789]